MTIYRPLLLDLMIECCNKKSVFAHRQSSFAAFLLLNIHKNISYPRKKFVIRSLPSVGLLTSIHSLYIQDNRFNILLLYSFYFIHGSMFTFVFIVVVGCGIKGIIKYV